MQAQGYNSSYVSLISAHLDDADCSNRKGDFHSFRGLRVGEKWLSIFHAIEERSSTQKIDLADDKNNLLPSLR